MSFDLYVWFEPGPITEEAAKSKADRGASGDTQAFTPHPAISVMRDELLAQFPPLEDLSDEDFETRAVWSMTPARSDSVLVLSCGWSWAGEVTTAVRRLAAAHGLICYDPQESIVSLPTAATFELRSLTGAAVPDPDAAQIERLVRQVGEDNFFALLVRSDNFFAQVGYGRNAGAAPGVYALEHRSGPEGEHLRAETTDVAEAVRFLQEFRAGDESWRGRHLWTAIIL